MHSLNAEERKWLRQEVSRRRGAKVDYKNTERGLRNLDRDLRALGIDIPLQNKASINRRKYRKAHEQEQENG